MEIGMKTGHEKEEGKRGMHHPRLDRRVIRSLGDEESVDTNERMVPVLRRERMVTHDFADTSFWIPVRAFRGSFFQGNALLVHFLLGPRVAPINKVPMKPCFMMAALIIRSQAECFPWDGECTMLMQFPKT